MTGLRQPLAPRSSPTLLLEKARDLAEWVRATAERVHEKAKETRRLTEVVKRQSEEGRLLVGSSHRDAQAIKILIRHSYDIINEAGRRLSGKERG